MRITGGQMRGRIVPGKVRDGVRPTSSRVREALFSMIGQTLEDTTVLDACSGSGLLTFEAVSRGATVTTVERNRSTAYQIKQAAEQLGVKLDLRIDDARNVMSSGTWGVVILDPPYDEDPVEWIAAAACAVEEILVMEHRSGQELPADVGPLALLRSRKHGESVLTLYRRRSDAGVQEVSVVGEDSGVVEDDP
jgi:16S rRNA (guanine966-N2)-methyltransferase